MVKHTQTCALFLIKKKWRKSIDNGRVSGVVMADLSKAFDSINYNLLIAKLAASVFDCESLRFAHSYLIGRKQRTKINNVCSFYSDITYVVPQGPILSPLFYLLASMGQE